MKALLFCLFFSVALAVDLIQVDLIQQSVHKDVFKAKQAKRLAKWGKAARTLPKYHEKLFESVYRNDYITTYIQFGNPLQNFSVIISSGGTRAWVLDETYPQKTDSQNTYIPENSKTATKLGTPYNHTDGSYTVLGNWYTDNFHFGKARVNSQAFGSAQVVTDPLDDALFPVDGVFGISHLAAAAYGEKKEPVAPIDNLMAPLVKKMVSLFLDKQVAPSKGFSKGALTIGSFDKTHCDEDSLSVSMPFSTTTTSDNRLVHSISTFQYGTYASSSGLVFIDTGISTLQLPNLALKSIFDQIQPDYDWDTGLYTVPCANIDDLSYMYFYFVSSWSVNIDAPNFVVDLDLDDGQCALALEMVSPEYTSVDFVLGTPFVRNSCLVYDFDAAHVNLYDSRS